MARRRFRRKDLKRPDEFVSRGRQLLNWAIENNRTVGWGAGVVVLVVLVAAGIVSARSARIRQANEELTQALGQFRAGHYGEAATQLTELAERWQSTPAGRIAGLYAATANLKADKFEQASALLQEALNAPDWPPYLRQAALVDLGLALERKGDAAAAAARYGEATSVEGPYTATAILAEARCRTQVGEKDKARALYERFTREFPQSPELELVGARIEALKT
jgi:outer membrane protein assembly factor BamD (BamD/ComL family)